MKLIPFLGFNGKTHEAMAFYAQVLGGKVTSEMKYRDMPPMESKVVVLLASMSVGANVYMMSHQFKALEGPIASSLVLSTILASITTPLMLTLIGA